MSSTITTGGWTLVAVVGLVLFATLLFFVAMAVHSRTPRDPNVPRMTVREFVKGIRF